ncbi:hypothetical protein Y1Q_0013074 [Alligator mississippiensis]|uniref:Uncharacterized protein n=1 Tax=Alligator mississippiensis TaxID=8496 RepID=A0A151P6R0_ALLMI|nr:hypothetical protein Y1Q_0013074 [Alligator mississippiensis]
MPARCLDLPRRPAQKENGDSETSLDLCSCEGWLGAWGQLEGGVWGGQGHNSACPCRGIHPHEVMTAPHRPTQGRAQGRPKRHQRVWRCRQFLRRCQQRSLMQGLLLPL